jgi:hypothetical protein
MLMVQVLDGRTPRWAPTAIPFLDLVRRAMLFEFSTLSGVFVVPRALTHTPQTWRVGPFPTPAPTALHSKVPITPVPTGTVTLATAAPTAAPTVISTTSYPTEMQAKRPVATPAIPSPTETPSVIPAKTPTKSPSNPVPTKTNATPAPTR